MWEKKWKESPYNGPGFEHLVGAGGSWIMNTYWLLSVMERAKSTDAEKIIKIWEGDTYRYVNGKVVKMRACDHKIIQDLSIDEYVVPDQQKVSMTIPPTTGSITPPLPALFKDTGGQDSALDGSKIGTMPGKK